MCLLEDTLSSWFKATAKGKPAILDSSCCYTYAGILQLGSLALNKPWASEAYGFLPNLRLEATDRFMFVYHGDLNWTIAAVAVEI